MLIRRWLIVFGAVTALAVALSCGDDDPLVPVDLTAGGDDGAGPSEGTLLVPAEWAGVWRGISTVTVPGEPGKRTGDPVEYDFRLCEEGEWNVDLMVNGRTVTVPLRNLDGSILGTGEIVPLVSPDTAPEGEDCDPKAKVDVEGFVSGGLVEGGDPIDPLSFAYTVTIAGIPPPVSRCGRFVLSGQDAAVRGGSFAITNTLRDVLPPGELSDPARDIGDIYPGEDVTLYDPGAYALQFRTEGFRLRALGENEGCDDAGSGDGTEGDFEDPGDSFDIFGGFWIDLGGTPLEGNHDGSGPGELHLTVGEVNHGGVYTVTLHDANEDQAEWGHDGGGATTIHGDGYGTYTHTWAGGLDVVHGFDSPVTLTVHGGNTTITFTDHGDYWNVDHSDGSGGQGSDGGSHDD